MKIISKPDLNTVNAEHECFIIKNVFHPDHCDDLLIFLDNFSKSNANNEKYMGENWHYWVTANGNNFDSFLFQNLNGIEFPLIKNFYREIFSLYKSLGEKTYYDDFNKECGLQEDAVKMINPLIFWYKAGLSKFGWHKHPSSNQKFQLLSNLTSPGIDYTGGETYIYMGDGPPEQGNLDNCEIFGFQFEKGDVFSFPYDRWHKVNSIQNGSGGWQSRVSLLMPLGKRSGGDLNEYIDEL